MWRVLKLCRLLTGIAFAASLVVLGAARLTYRDPFAPYRAIMPGQSIDGLQQYPCHFEKALDLALVSCEFNVDATFSGRITVDASNRVITGTKFLIRSGDVNLGDLTLCWGKPSGTILNVPPHSSPSADIYWGEHTYATFELTQSDAQPSEFTPTSYISMGNPPLACGSGQ